MRVIRIVDFSEIEVERAPFRGSQNASTELAVLAIRRWCAKGGGDVEISRERAAEEAKRSEPVGAIAGAVLTVRNFDSKARCLGTAAHDEHATDSSNGRD
jgi:hypothetical protein